MLAERLNERQPQEQQLWNVFNGQAFKRNLHILYRVYLPPPLLPPLENKRQIFIIHLKDLNLEIMWKIKTLIEFFFYLFH